MGLHPNDAWQSVSQGPIFAVVLTLAAYELSRRLWERSGRNPLVNPVLLSIAAVGTALWALGIDYSTYTEGGRLISLFLGPATVALALPMHRELALLRQAALPIVAGVVTGTGVAVVAAMGLTKLFGGSLELALSMAPKSTTTPVAIALAEPIDGVPALTAVLTIVTGILGAVLGPRVLTWSRFRDERVRGLAVGASSHGIGTATMLHESRTEGAFSGLAMALATLSTSLWVPLLVPVLRDWWW